MFELYACERPCKVLIVSRMCRECEENVHCTENEQKMCRKCAPSSWPSRPRCAANVHCAGLCTDCVQIVHHLHDSPVQNSSPSSNSIPNSILSLRFLSLGMFRMFLVLARVRVDIRLRVFFKVPVAVATARINSENFRLRAYPHNVSPFQLDIRARSVINAIASSKISSSVPSSTASRNRRPWGRATRRFYEGQRWLNYCAGSQPVRPWYTCVNPSAWR